MKPADLYGRGYSEAPELPFDPNLASTQLALLLQYVGWSSTDVIGFSMVRPLHDYHHVLMLNIASQGGAIAAAFSVSFPHLIRNNVVLMSAVGVMVVSTSFLESVYPY